MLCECECAEEWRRASKEKREEEVLEFANGHGRRRLAIRLRPWRAIPQFGSSSARAKEKKEEV